MTKNLATMTSDQLMGLLGQPGSMASQEVTLEFMRRQTEAQIVSARWMRWSVVALTATAIISAVVQIYLQISN